MAATIFTALSNLRMLISGETDGDSPVNETTYAALRYAIEALLMLAFGTGITGSATSDPPDDTTGVLTDSAKSWTADEHNGKSVVITSGAAVGNCYVIDDSTTTTLICTDDNLYSDGVRSGDDYIILYDLKVNEDGHNHDGTNSALLQTQTGQDVLACDDAEEGTEYSSATVAWIASITHKVYIPDNVDRVRAMIRAKKDGGTGGSIRFTIGGSSSNTYTVTGSYAWTATCYLDVSALSGWQTLTIDFYGPSSTYKTFVQGYSFIYETT